VNDPEMLVATLKLARTVAGSAPVAAPSSCSKEPELWVTCRCASSVTFRARAEEVASVEDAFAATAPVAPSAISAATPASHRTGMRW
jgi:hypothetical protein